MKRLNQLMVALLWLPLAALAITVDDNEPYLIVLGTAQDAGFPQSGCYQPHCLGAWKDPALREPATSLGLIDPRGKRKYLFEATPHFPEQLYQLEIEAPSSHYRLRGIFLSHAHIGHYTGLMHLGHEAMGSSNKAGEHVESEGFNIARRGLRLPL